MSKKSDLIGQKFNRLTVIKEGEPEKYYNKKTGKYTNRTRWWCKCDCGNENLILVVGANLKRGKPKSCGCLHKEKSKLNGENSKKYNTYDLTGEYGVGYTSNTNEPFYFDLEDYDKIKDYCWRSHKLKNSNYKALETTVHNGSEVKTIRFHYLLDRKGWDHIDRNPFNNRKNNLRKSTKQQNAINCDISKNNTSGATGVSWDKRSKKWVVGIGINGKWKSLGRFTSFEEAKEARVRAEIKYYGEFSPNWKE